MNVRSESPAWRQGRRVAVGVVGGAVTLCGLALMPLPGPGLVVTLVGLAILASEFERARAVRRWLRSRARSSIARLRGPRDRDHA